MIYDTPPVSFNSVAKDIPAGKLPDNVLSDGVNILFQDGYFESRPGIRLVGNTSLPLNGPINGIFDFAKLRTDVRYLVLCTLKDIYVYDQSTQTYKYKTRNYNAST